MEKYMGWLIDLRIADETAKIHTIFYFILTSVESVT